MIENFSEMNLTPQLLRGLDKMGFTAPTPVQDAAVGPMLEGGDLLVQAPTGTGKTCAFGIPVVEMTDTASRQLQTVILCPTRELAIQTAGVLKRLTAYKPGVRVLAVYGGEPIGHQIAALRRKPQIVVATPGRLMDHMKRRTVRLSSVSQIVLDEADRMLDMGFLGDIETILESVPGARQTVLFSATLSTPVRQIAGRFQRDAASIQIRQNTPTVERVEQYYSEISGKSKTPVLLDLLQEKKFGLSLVFVSTKSMADRLAEQLNEGGFKADALHGDLQQRKRDAVMDRYRRGHINILVATDVAARGIDVHNIDAVINYDIPGDADSYIHRIGRTGRADSTGAAYTLINPREYGKLMSYADKTGAKIVRLGPGRPAAAGATRSGAGNKPHWKKRGRGAPGKRAASPISA